jgi:hypothetical protein
MSASKNTARSFIAKKVSLYPGGHMKIVSSVLTTGPMIRPRNYTLQHPLIAKAYDSLPDSTKKNGAKILKDIPVDLYPDAYIKVKTDFIKKAPPIRPKGLLVRNQIIAAYNSLGCTS